MSVQQTNSPDTSPAPATDIPRSNQDTTREFLTIIIGDQRFGIPILQIQDVLRQRTITKVPLSPPEVAGSLNLRGRIVTAIDVRCRLNIAKPPPALSSGQPQPKSETGQMSVVVENESELYSLIIDEVGDVMALDQKNFENTPGTLDPVWREVSSGIYRLENELLVVLDIPRLLQTVHT